MLGDGFEITNTEWTGHVVDKTCALRQHGFGCRLALGDVTECARVRPKQSHIGLLAGHFRVLGIAPMHTKPITRFKLIEHGYLDAENGTNFIVSIVGRHHGAQCANQG